MLRRQLNQFQALESFLLLDAVVHINVGYCSKTFFRGRNVGANWLRILLNIASWAITVIMSTIKIEINLRYGGSFNVNYVRSIISFFIGFCRSNSHHYNFNNLVSEFSFS